MKVNKSFTKVSDLKWISVWCKSYSQNFGTLYIPKFDGNNVNPNSDKKKGNANPDTDKKGNGNPDSDMKGNDNSDSDKKGDVNPDSEPDLDDHVIIESGSDMENNKASGMKFTVIYTLITVFLSFSLSNLL